jgi:hypothetical protein
MDEANRMLEEISTDKANRILEEINTNATTTVEELRAVIKNEDLSLDEFEEQTRRLIKKFTDQIDVFEQKLRGEIMQEVDDAIDSLVQEEKMIAVRAMQTLREITEGAIDLQIKASEENELRESKRKITEMIQEAEELEQTVLSLQLSTESSEEEIQRARHVTRQVTELTQRMNAAINSLLKDKKKIIMRTLDKTAEQLARLLKEASKESSQKTIAQTTLEYVRREKEEVNGATDSSTETLQQQIEKLKRAIQRISNAIDSLVRGEQENARTAVQTLSEAATRAGTLLGIASPGNLKKENTQRMLSYLIGLARNLTRMCEEALPRASLEQKIRRAQKVATQATGETQTISHLIGSLVQGEKDLARNAAQRLVETTTQLEELLSVVSRENRQKGNAQTLLSSTVAVRQRANNVMHLSGGSPREQITQAKTATHDAMQKISDIGSVAVELVRDEIGQLDIGIQNLHDLNVQIHDIMNLFENRKIKSQLEDVYRSLSSVYDQIAQFQVQIALDHQEKKQQITTAKEINEQIIRAAGIAQNMLELVGKRTHDFKFALAFVVFLIPAITSGVIVACLPLGAIGTNFMLSNSIMMSLHIANACKIGIAVLIIGALAFVGFMLSQRKINNLTNQIQNHELSQEEIKPEDTPEASALRNSLVGELT